MIGPGVVLGPELERIITVAPYGFRLWDPVSGRSVSKGLQVALREASGRRIKASTSPSGIFAIHHVSGLDDFEDGPGDAAFWTSPPTVADGGVIEVDDPSGQFLPFSFRPDVPTRIGQITREICAPSAGGILAQPPASPPEAGLPILPLFSTAARPLPSGMARVSAQLETTDGRPVTGAIVRVRPAGEPPAYGQSDDRGVVTVLVPYPRPAQPLLSPPSIEATPLAAQSWDDVTVSAFWSPRPPDRYPDICESLAQLDSPPVALLADTSPAAELTSVRLEYGAPLDLRTTPLSVLIVEAGSPPSL
jgi:hypothetical protein